MFRFESFLVSWVFKCIRVSMGNLLGVEIDSVKKKKKNLSIGLCQ